MKKERENPSTQILNQRINESVGRFALRRDSKPSTVVTSGDTTLGHSTDNAGSDQEDGVSLTSQDLSRLESENQKMTYLRMSQAEKQEYRASKVAKLISMLRQRNLEPVHSPLGREREYRLLNIEEPQGGPGDTMRRSLARGWQRRD